MAEPEVPVAEYPQILLDVVGELRQRHYEAAAKLCGQLDPDLAVSIMATMLTEVIGRLETARGLEPGRLAERMRAEYVVVAGLCSDGVVTPPALFGGPKRVRRVQR
jgi:hypothetical protein